MFLRRGAHERDVGAHGLPGTGHSAQLSGPQPLVRSRAQRPELPRRGWGGGHVGVGGDGQSARGERRAVTCHHGYTVPPIQQMMRAGNNLPGTLRIPGEGQICERRTHSVPVLQSGSLSCRHALAWSSAAYWEWNWDCVYTYRERQKEIVVHYAIDYGGWTPIPCSHLHPL